jgi:hypothetical protein
MLKTKAFLYRWTQTSTGMWYEGSRTRKGCHPDDGYICSSKKVKPLILENPTDWNREVLVIGEPVYIRKLEEIRLKSLDAKNDPMSYNQDNGDGNFTTTKLEITDEWRKNLSKASKGKPKSESHRNNMEIANKKKAADPAILKKLQGPKPSGHGAAVSKATKGKKKSAIHCKNLSIAQTKVARKLRKDKTYEEIFGAEKAADIKKRKNEKLSLVKGAKHHAHGKTYEEIYGIEKAAEMRWARSKEGRLAKLKEKLK